MKYRKLGDSGIDVSLICLGTMTWGEQNSMEDAFGQMEYALEQGVNFWDTAEMYPIPVKSGTAGQTERCIGEWFRKTGRRNEVILATKVTGRSKRHWIRNQPETRLTREQINQAIDSSLKRLQTDYVDLYQLHWPDRHINLWGEGDGSYIHKGREDEVPIAETLEAMTDLVTAGKVRTVGVSNETPWGMSQYLDQSAHHGRQRVVSIQNSYSLLNRIYETGLSEFSYRENIGLLAYSPLAMGALTGKYMKGPVPAGSRLDLFPEFLNRFRTDTARQALARYVQLAREVSLTPTQLALGFVNTRPFLTSNIIGATTLEQLKENIETVHVDIPKDLETEINRIHSLCKNPAAT